MKYAIIVLLFILCPASSIAGIIHVPGDQPTIQAGINGASPGDTVLVADGTYTGDGNRDIHFFGMAITVRSENGPENCIIDCHEGHGEYHRGFRFHSGESGDSVLAGFTIQNGNSGNSNYGGAIYISDSSPTITNCTIYGNEGFKGGGIYCKSSSSTITSCTFNGNRADAGGGGIDFEYGSSGASPTITNCFFNENVAGAGGGISFAFSSPTITNCTFSSNIATVVGGGIYCGTSSATITNGTFNGNMGLQGGGGIYCDGDPSGASPTITNCTFSSNTAPYVDQGGGICCIFSSPTITNCIVWDNFPDEINVYSDLPTVSFSDVQGGWPGEGNIDADPLFVTGPHGEYSLSQIVCGDPATSPCVDAGDPVTEVYGTTNCIFDTGIVDMGYHYPAPGLVVGPGPAYANPPDVRSFLPEQDAENAFEFPAYGPRHYGVNVTCGDMTGNGMVEVLTGAGPGEMYGPHVRGFQVDGEPLPGLSYFAYGTHKYGVNVAAGDIDGDGFDEIITGAGPGAVFGPHVRAFDYDGTPGVTSTPGVNYFAYGTPKWGVNVSCGDIDGDGFDEIVTGAGPGTVYGPHVRGWNVDGGEAAAMPGVCFMAYGTNQYGVNVTCGDLDGDGIEEIVTGPGPGPAFGAHVRGWDYDGETLTEISGINFSAWNSSEVLYGVNVFTGVDLDGDGRSELVVGCGPDPAIGTPVKVFQYDGTAVTEWISLDAFGDLGLTHGTTVAAGRF